MDKELLFFKPVFKTLVWGGHKMRDEFGYDIPSENTGECWAISAHQNGDVVCVSNGYKGMTLSKLWDTKRELFGNFRSDRFPLLTKIIDAADDLSIQVHPDDEYAKVHENGSYGKEECWYVLDCDEDSSVIIGHNANSKEEFDKMIDEGRFKDLIREVPVHKGDFIRIAPGTLHAIKGGVMVLETQQNSDITYRLYDYDRLSDGKLRELHIDKAKDVVVIPTPENAIYATSSDRPVETLIECKYFSVYKLNVKGTVNLDNEVPFRLVSVIEGEGKINGNDIKKGMHFIVPAGFGSLSFTGNMKLITSVPASL